MGADIYLRSRSNAAHAEWEPKFEAAVAARNAKYPSGVTMPEDAPEQKAVSEAYEGMYSAGYFRDSYNATSLFWLLGLSWWDNDFISDGKMKVRGMTRLRAVLDEHPITDALMLEWADKNAGDATIEPTGDNSLAGWKAMFTHKREKLIALLDEAIALKEPLECSC